MHGVVCVEAIAGDQRIEEGFFFLGAKQPAEALGLFLAGAEGTGDLDG